MILSIKLLASRLIVITTIIAGLIFLSDHVSAKKNTYFIQQPVHEKVSQPDSLQLTDQKIKDWIRTRIAVARLQNKMKANAADYNNLVEEFYIKRETLLESRGWSVNNFDTVKERIHAAITAMDMQDELEETRADHEEEIAEIGSNEFFSDEQKEEMINALKTMRNQKKTLYIDPVKRDLPAIRPHRSTLQHMMSWIAGNTAHPPELK